MKTLFLYFIIASVSGRMKSLMKYADDKKIDKDSVSVNNIAVSLGSCPCDLTNSCDVYCCCDPDCEEAITNFWEMNYGDYCAKSYI